MDLQLPAQDASKIDTGGCKSQRKWRHLPCIYTTIASPMSSKAEPLPASAPPTRLTITDRDAWKKALATRRPIVVHLNADTTWLVQLPRPASDGRRSTFNLLIDPWLQGPQSDVASWFSTQWHVVAPSVHTLAALEQLLREVDPNSESSATEDGAYIDAVAISHEFTDHCHRATLEELPRSTPVIATDKAANLIRSWKHFDTVVTTPGFPGPDSAVPDLPSWLSIGRVVSPGNALYYHSAIVIVFDSDTAPNSSKREAIVYSPHGIKPADLKSIQKSGVPTLALLHGLHDVRIWMSKQLNLGGRNAAEAVRAAGARYWIATHDEVKKGGGFISLLLRRTVHPPPPKEEGAGYKFVELGSGDGVVLE
ncbi:hypothetical protein MKEN_01241300 [Mycena kentingensis (nom. inval.)]|nr:hypothetical protein MKEN_01241300 [Mycena kentingensis (nom. inval.)]